MARAKREQLTCTGCGRVGLTTHGRVRRALYLLALLGIAALVLTDLLGLTALGDQLWAVGISIMLLSLGLRLLVRGDRCPDCGEPAVLLRRPPADGGA